MKKSYETPSIEVVKFQYRDQVVAASNTYHKCETYWMNEKAVGDGDCVPTSNSTMESA